MNRSLLVTGLLLLGACRSSPDDGAGPSDGGATPPRGMRLGGDGGVTDFFQTEAIHQLDIQLPAGEWEELLQENRNLGAAPVWHEVTLTIDGTVAMRVGAKTFGFGSRQANPEKPNFNVDLNRSLPGQNYLGIGKMRLKNNGQDPSALRQVITYEALRNADVIAPRSTYADVSVNGQPFGFYMIEESFSKDLVKARTGNNDGAGYEADDCQGFVAPVPDGCNGLPAHYKRSFNPLVGAGEDLVHLCTVLAGAPADFVAGAGQIIKLDEWLRAVAADTALAGDYDGFSTNGTNFRLYHDTALDRLRLVILGPDTSYDPDFFPDPTEPKPDDNCQMTNPLYHDVFLEKVRATPEGLAMYKQAVTALRQGAMAPATLKARVDALWAIIGAHVKADLHPAPMADPEMSKDKIKQYIDVRDADLTAKGF
jgi:hypothetical protein